MSKWFDFDRIEMVGEEMLQIDGVFSSGQGFCADVRYIPKGDKYVVLSFEPGTKERKYEIVQAALEQYGISDAKIEW